MDSCTHLKAILIGAQILVGDCRDILRTLPAGSVQCCVTSPPYWGLRDYGTAAWEGGEPGCEHTGISRGQKPDDMQNTSPGSSRDKVSKNCRICGARRIDAQLGLEATPEENVANMVAVFREVWRVLRDDGTLWLNLGDSYGSGASGQNFFDPNGERPGGGRLTEEGGFGHRKRSGIQGMHKQLLGIPWRVALALQADGWYLRSDIIWAKPNPMPESVTDRATKAHEYIFLLTKQERYFYDAEAIKEPTSELTRWTYAQPDKAARNGQTRNGTGKTGLREYSNGLRNRRSVWTVATQPYKESHFAVFPEDLIKPCILAGTKLGDTVLDPFSGSGTTGKVALELGRSAILIELNPDYAELARARTNVTPGFL